MLTGLPSIGFPTWLPNMGTDRPAAGKGFPGQLLTGSALKKVTLTTQLLRASRRALFILISSLGQVLPFPSKERASNVSHCGEADGDSNPGLSDSGGHALSTELCWL